MFLDQEINLDLNYEIIKDIADECRMPFTYGGGINNLKQVEKLFLIGVKKYPINTAALENDQIIKSLSKIYGSQSVVISIDIKKIFWKIKKFTILQKKNF